MSGVSARQGIRAQRKLGSAQSSASLAARQKQRREMDFLKEMRQVMSRDHQGPSAADCVLVREGKKQREADRFGADNSEVRYRVPAKSPDYQKSIDEVMSSLSARVGLSRDARRASFLQRPVAPEVGSSDYEAFEATRNNIYAQMLATAPRKAVLSDIILPRVLLDQFTSIKSDSEGEGGDGLNAAHIVPVVDGKPVISQELEGVSDLAASAKFYQKIGLLRFQAGFGIDEKRLLVSSVRVMQTQGRNRVLEEESLLEVALLERQKVVDSLHAILKAGYVDLGEGESAAKGSVVIDFSTQSFQPFKYVDGAVSAIYMSSCGMTSSEFGLAGNVSIPISDSVTELMMVLYRHSIRVKGVGELDSEAVARIETRKQEIIDYNNGKSSKNVINERMFDAGEKTSLEEEIIRDIASLDPQTKGKSKKENTPKRDNNNTKAKKEYPSKKGQDKGNWSRDGKKDFRQDRQDRQDRQGNKQYNKDNNKPKNKFDNNKSTNKFDNQSTNKSNKPTNRSNKLTDNSNKSNTPKPNNKSKPGQEDDFFTTEVLDKPSKENKSSTSSTSPTSPTSSTPSTPVEDTFLDMDFLDEPPKTTKKLSRKERKELRKELREEEE
ncbi:hypothetical protein CJU90_1044 [Yarrowia sp. C11]|nr:hypothetical protein CKK34_2457 [Yarrowia sp. E02]KAG5373350.1 hypothetical protein CJU90_1044 [Yarrowia sp. C11]